MLYNRSETLDVLLVFWCSWFDLVNLGSPVWAKDRGGPNQYLKAKEKISLYASTKFKSGSKKVRCLDEEPMVCLRNLY